MVSLLNFIELSERISELNKFIAGEPIKYPTNVVLGFSNKSFGNPT